MEESLRECYVYFFLKPSGIVFYVGVGSYERSCDFKHRNRFCKSVIKSIGGAPIVTRILVENYQEAFLLERKMIKKYGRRDQGVGELTNLTDGGEAPANLNSEARRKMAYWKGRKLTSEQRAAKGRKGWKHTKEAKEKISRANKGRPLSEKTRLAVIESNRKRRGEDRAEQIRKNREQKDNP